MDVRSLNEANEYILNKIYPMLNKDFNIISLKWEDDYDIVIVRDSIDHQYQYRGTFIRFELGIKTIQLSNFKNTDFCNIELDFYYDVVDNTLFGIWNCYTDDDSDEPTEKYIYRFLDEQCIKISRNIEENQKDLNILKNYLPKVHSKIKSVCES